VEFLRVIIGGSRWCKLAASQRDALRRTRINLLQSSFFMQTGVSRGKLPSRNLRDSKSFLLFGAAGIKRVDIVILSCVKLLCQM